MKRSNPLVAVGIVCLVFALFIGAAFMKSQKTTLSVAVSASWSEGFDTVEEMAGAADLIALGVVKDSVPELRGNLVFTMNTVEVRSVWKGDVREGETVELLQTGGTLGATVTPAFSELPLLEKDREYLLFLRYSPEDEPYGAYYLISGGFQGAAMKAADGTFTALARANAEFVESGQAYFAAMQQAK